MINGFQNLKTTFPLVNCTNDVTAIKSVPEKKETMQVNTCDKKNSTVKIIGGAALLLVLVVGSIKSAKSLLKAKLIKGSLKPEGPIISELEKFTENFIKTVNPKDEKTAREVLPEILKYNEHFGLKNDLKILDEIISQITPGNKEYILKKGLSSLAEHVEKIKSFVKDPEKIYKILSCLAADNEKVFPKILEESQKLKINKVNHINNYLLTLNDKTSEFAFNDILPQIQKYHNKLKIKNSSQIVDIIDHTNPETLNVIEMVGDNASKFGLPDYTELILAINKDNKSNASFIFENYQKLGLNKLENIKPFENLLNKNYEDLLVLIE